MAPMVYGSGGGGGFDRYLDWLLRYRRMVVAALVAATAFWASQLPALRVEIDPDANLPQHHPYIQALHILEDKFGEKNLIVIGLFPKDKNVFTPAFLAKLERITRRIEEVPGLIWATYLSIASPLVKAIEGDDETLLVRPVLEDTPDSEAVVAEVRRRLFVNPLHVGTVIAADGSAAAIVANFRLTAELPGYPALHERVAALVAEEQDGSFAVHFGGPVAISTAVGHVTERTVLLFPFALLVVALIHYEAFRTLQGMVLPLVTALLAVVWSLGLMGLLQVPLDPFNTTTPILILAVAAGHAVQVLKRYYEEYDRCRDTTTAVRVAVSRVGPVMLTAGTIAALSFFSLTVFATATIRNFGLLTGFGIVAALIIELTLIPAVRVMLPAPRATEMLREARGGRFLEQVLNRLANLVATRPRTVIALGLVLAALSVTAATRLRVDTTLKRQFGRTHPVRIDDDALNKAFAGTNTLVLLVEGPAENALHDPTVLTKISDLQTFVASDPVVGKVISIVDLLREMHHALTGDEARVPPSAELVSQYLLLYSMSGEPDDLDSHIDSEHRSAAVRVFLHEESTEYAQALIARVRSRVASTFPPGYTVRYSGTIASNTALTETMVRGKLLNMAQIALIIIVVAGFMLRSVLGGLLVAAPLAIAVLVNFAVMGMLGIPLDIMTAPIAAMAVGIGSDYAIYFIFRFREELALTNNRADALATTLRTSGKAIVYVSSAIAGGYLVLCASGFVFHVELGVMVGLAMVMSSLAAITLLPALLLVTKPAFLLKTGEAQEKAPVRRAS